MLFNCGLHPLSSIQLGHIKGWSQSLVTLWNKICEFIYWGNLTIGMKYHFIKIFIKDWAMGDKSLVMPADYFCVSSFTQCSSIIFVWQIFQPVRQKITEQRHTDCLCLFVLVMVDGDSRHWVLSVPGQPDDSPDHPRIVPLWPSSNQAQPYITLQLN